MKIFLFIFSFIIVSCSHSPKIGVLLEKKDIELELLSSLEEIDLTNQIKFDAFLEDTKKEILLTRRQKEISSETWNKISRLLKIYKNVKNLAPRNQILIPQKTKLSIKMDSFCIDPHLASPTFKEIFQWTYDTLSVPYYKEILRYFSSKKGKRKEKIQELIWNLANKTYYESYPEDLKKILNEIDPKAFLKLPSRTKSEIIDFGVSKIEEMSGTDIRGTIDLVQGKYYSFREFKTALESRESSWELSKTDVYSKIPQTSLFSEIQSDTYQNQTIHIYNPRDEAQLLDFNRYYLTSLRNDVQRIALTASFGNIDYINKKLDEFFTFILGHLGSLYPTLNKKERDLVKKYPYEALIIFGHMRTVEKASEKLFGKAETTQIDGEADAFRHFVWAGLLTYDLGKEMAKQFLDAHESEKSVHHPERKMDDHNNKKGIEAALQLIKNNIFNDKNLYERALETLKNKDLVILHSEEHISIDTP